MSRVPEQKVTLNAYDETSVSQNDPEIQISAQYNTSGRVRSVVVGTGSTDVAGGEFQASCGTDTNGTGVVFSERQVITKVGEGTLARFTARFPTSAANSRQYAGLSSALDSVSFGYENEVFGSLYSFGGAVMIEELTVTVAATGGENATLTINGTGYTVPLTSGSIAHNCTEIAESLQAQVSNFNFTQNGNTVVGRSLFAAPSTGAWTLSSATAVGTFSTVNAGLTQTRVPTARAEWNVNTMPDLDPAMMNMYSVQFNGNIEYFVNDTVTGEQTLVHVILGGNTATEPMFSIAAFRSIWSVSNQGSTTDQTIYGASAAAFTQGFRQATALSESRGNTAAAVGTTLTNIISIRCREVYGTKVNLGRLIPTLVTAGNESANKGAILEIILGATFSGDSDFEYVDKGASIAEVDTTANTVSGGERIATIILSPLGTATADLAKFNAVILPGQVLTLAMRSTLGTAAMAGSLLWDEDL